ncbi:hypothetical protein C2G38_2061868, partial [Gigaspora rosea]
MNLHCSQASITDLIEKFKYYVQLEKYRIHGLTQSTETSQYMIVLDFYNNKQNPSMEHLCDPQKKTQEIGSRDKNIDDCIKEFQLKATAYEKVIEWIPFDRLINIKTIGKGGFGTVYSSVWLDGKRIIEGDNSVGYVRFRNKSCMVALKTLPGPQTISSSFLNE